MITQENIHLISVIILSLGLIFLGGALFYKHNDPPLHERNPIFWALAIALASGGGSILLGLIFKTLLPKELSNTIKNIKSQKI
jgi:hypothetical protein